jgi:hypothetical protein
MSRAKQSRGREAEAIRIRSEAEFSTLLTALTGNTASALIHWRLFQDLSAAVRPYVREMNDSLAFWRLTHAAHWQTALSRLARVYDTYPGALSLPNFLATIRVNLHFFDQPRFRERLKGNPYVDSLTAGARRPDARTLWRDARNVSAEDPRVDRLLKLRHQLLAHHDPRVEYGSIDPLRALPKADVSVLCKRAKRITNRYTRLFRASTDLMQMVGHDDYKRVLEHVRNDLAARRRRIDAEIARAMRSPR